MQNQYKCGGDTLSRNITVSLKPPPPAFNGPKNACAGFSSVYKVTTGSGQSYFWKVKGGTITNISNQTKTISIKWPSADTSARVMIVEKDSLGCFSDTAILKVNVAPAVADKIFGSLSVCPNSNYIDYWALAQKGATYYWFVSGGTQVDGGNSSQISISWGSQGTGTVKLVEVTAQGCIGDTVTLTMPFVQQH